MNNERKKDNVIGKTMVSKNVHILIPPNWEWVTLPGKRYFADVIKLHTLSRREYPGLSRWAQCNQKGP